MFTRLIISAVATVCPIASCQGGDPAPAACLTVGVGWQYDGPSDTWTDASGVVVGTSTAEDGCILSAE